MFVLRAVNKMHKHTYTEYLCVRVRVFVNSYVALCVRVARQCDRKKLCVERVPKPNLTTCTFAGRSETIRSLRFVPLSGSSLVAATIESRSSCQRLRRSSLRRASSSDRADKPVMQRRDFSRGSRPVCSGVTVNLV